MLGVWLRNAFLMVWIVSFFVVGKEWRSGQQWVIEAYMFFTRYDMLMQDLNAQIAQATADRGQKAETKAKKLQAKADATGDLKDHCLTIQPHL